MASTDFQSKVKEFVKASAPGGKSDTVTNKTLKRINEDCNLKSATGLTQTDLDIKFSGGLAKIKAKGGMTISQFEDFCKNYLAEQIAKSTKGDKDEIAKKIHDKICQGSVKSHGATKTVKTGGVERMTDSSKFTGSHKERFDAAGKGKGLEGRVNKVDDSGYVGNYKMQGTYDKKM